MTRPQQYPPLATFERSPLTQALVDRLRQVPEGEVIAYKEMSAIALCDVQEDRGRGYLQSAKSILLREHRIVFGTVTNVGWKRADESGVVDISDRDLKGIHRAARRTARKLSVVTSNERLSPTQRLRLMVNRARLGLVRTFTSEKAAVRLAKAAQEDEKRIGAAEVQRRALKMFE